jgi:hypothetical protein
MKRTSCAAILLASCALFGSGPVSAEEKVTITGCLVNGDGDGDGFLLANAVEQRTVSAPTATGENVSTSTTTTMRPSRVLYWLDDDDDVVERMMGQLVEITGEVEGDVEKGEIDIERENGLIELELDADGRKATVRLPDVPSAVGTSGSVSDREVEVDYTVRKLDVKSAKSIAPSCR